MANKDLNLSLDSSLIRPQRTSANEQAFANTANTTGPDATNEKLPPAQTAPPASKKNSQPHSKSPLFSLTLITAINSLLLILIGLALLTKDVPPAPSQTLSRELVIPPAFNQTLATSFSSIDTQLQQLQNQIGDLQLKLAEQVSLSSSVYTDIDNKLQALQKDLASQVKQSQSQPKTNWFINLGTFQNLEAATQLQQQLELLGYQATINQLVLDGKNVNRVQLADFDSRESAEKNAQQIMDQTKLNGLWVWKK